jgi:hypothetical protein
MLHDCSHDGCKVGGCIKLEVLVAPDYEKDPQRFKWFCEAHAEAFEADLEKRHDYAKRVEVIPVVGMGATAGYGSDRYPYTVIKVSTNGKTITVQADDYKPAPGHHYINNQVYTYTPNPQGETKVFTLRDNGRWVLRGESKQGGLCLGLGVRRHYHDPSF